MIQFVKFTKLIFKIYRIRDLEKKIRRRASGRPGESDELIDAATTASGSVTMGPAFPRKMKMKSMNYEDPTRLAVLLSPDDTLSFIQPQFDMFTGEPCNS